MAANERPANLFPGHCAMPLKPCSRMPNKMRLKIFTALLAALLLALLAGLRGDAVSAQRKRPANDNTSQPAQKAGQTKHVFVGRGSDTAQGSRVTIKSDNPLNDYSAYRSGDRFYVVLPRAAAGSVARGGAGKGYSDMQVQQRGDSVVLSYRVQPGAKPRVEQKFNRLDVVFDTPGGGESSAASNAGQSSAAPSGNNARTTASNENRNPNTSGQSAGQTPSTSAAPNTSATGERRNAAGAENAGQQGAGQQNAVAPNATTPPPGATEPSGVEQGAQGTTLAPTSEQTPEATAAATPAGEQQVAEAQPQTQIAPITNTNPASSTEASSSLGTFLLRNWAVALVIALVVAGFGLIIAARRSTAAPPSSLEGLGGATTATLDEPRAARLKDAPAGSTLGTAEVSRAADAVPLASASALATGAHAEEAREESKEEEKWAEELPLAEGSAAAGAAVVAPAAEERAAEESAVEEVSTGVERLDAGAEEKSGATLAEEKTDSAVAEPFASATEPTLVDTGAVASSEATASSTEIAPAAEVDPDRARAETRHLLEGEHYERAVVGTSDSMARQMIAAELLSALAGRNPERRDRARDAFVENGYFDETAHDLHEAEAPAERAAAARSLALVGDRSATPHLVAALDDNSIDVRRAAVEALGALRDPAAVAP